MAGLPRAPTPVTRPATPARPGGEPARRTYTPEEQADLLKYCIRLPADDWGALSAGELVRLFMKDGEFRWGGHFVRVVNPTPSNKINRRSLVLGLAPPSRTSWLIPFEDVDMIYVRLTASQILIQKTVNAAMRALDENTRRLAAAT